MGYCTIVVLVYSNFSNEDTTEKGMGAISVQVTGFVHVGENYDEMLSMQDILA